MTRRLLALLASVALCATGLTALAVGPAGAKLHEDVRVAEGRVEEREYPPIPGNYPGSSVVYFTPPGCGHPAYGTFCDTIPFDIVVPDLGPVDDFYVTIEISWDDPEGVNDLDIYLFDDTQTQASQGDDTPSYTRMNQSASTSNPEVIQQFAPTLGRYNLTVVNWAGPNLGYTLKAFITVAEFEEPFELLAPEFSQTPPSDTSDDVGPPPFDFSATPPPGDSGPIAPTFGDIPVQPDTSLDFGPSDFEDNLAAPPAFATGQRLVRRPPRPVPGVVAAFWLGAVPLLLTATGLLLLARRRRDSFAYA